MKKRIVLPIIIVLSMLASLFAGCGNTADVAYDELAQNKIAVAFYSTTDSEAIAFHDYLEKYIGSAFDGVEFYTSAAIGSEEEEMEFLQDAIDNGCQAVMSFISYDIEKEVELCAANGVYYIMASATMTDEDFEKVADNQYFIGVIGPGAEIEYSAGADMAACFADKNEGSRYVILSFGSCLGNEMHRLRTVAMLETLEAKYGVKLGTPADELALTAEVAAIDAGAFSVTVVPGYLGVAGLEPFTEAAIDVLENSDYDFVMSAATGAAVLDSVKDNAKLGLVDCFTEENAIYFNEGKLDYLCGKYAAMIGPAFMACENAINGFGDRFRDNGRAFRLIQGFWEADGAEQFNEMYGYSGMTVNAYNVEDLYSVGCLTNPDANLDTLRDLVSAYSFEDVVKRRG